VKRLTALLASLAVSAPAWASQPVDGAYGFQPPVTTTAVKAFGFHNNLLMPIITFITLFVLALLIWIIVRYNSKANKEPRKFTHNMAIEIAWTLIPVGILCVIAVFSFPLLYEFDKEPDLAAIASGEVVGEDVDKAAAELGWINFKARGNQWNWTYSFPDYTDADGYAAEFTSNPLQRGLSTDSPAEPRNLVVDYPLVLPAGRYIRYYTGASDVIHSFAMPAFAIKTDSIPGRLNEGWFKVDTPGTYYGQCSELCGKDHAYMPIEIRIVPQAQFDRWIARVTDGDIDAATQMVQVIDTLGDTQLASTSSTDTFED